ncbi:FecR domain-containing protein [Pedobacter gandavensis]|uniref:FecR domain-containing protein n=1 Tax=Pedobacter gandavensis TaxID=2679963 RepID=UPI00292E684E|nr:FecR domain-containing protein [Pedobacter gandavensis]
MGNKVANHWNEKEELIKLKAGDELAFGKLYAHFSGKIYGQLLHLLKDQNLVDKLVQDLFLTIWDNRGSFPLKTAFETHLNTTAENLVFDYFRKFVSDEETELLIAHFGTLSEKELRLLIRKALSDDLPAGFIDLRLKKHIANLYPSLSSVIKSTDQKIKLIPFYKQRSFAYLAIACTALLVTGFMSMFYREFRSSKFDDPITGSASYGIVPGSNKAALLLPDGQTINLSEVKSGLLITESGITYNDGTELPVFTDGLDFTLKTPNGGQYMLTLSDGTKVWLNAASSLKFPGIFSAQKLRKVTLSGEAYFEVTKDAASPFVVKSARQEVKVLGTHFQVSSYPDDATVNTALLNGSVLVEHSFLQNKETLLKPGEELLLSESTAKVEKANVEDLLAWKNGLFVFKKEPIGSIMKKISRWYDVAVVYETGVDQDQVLSSEVSRFDELSTVLSQLELSGVVHFKLEAKRILVLK